jgi:hypothetical protein
MLFDVCQWWLHKLMLLTRLPQYGFWMFVGGLVGCTFRWFSSKLLPATDKFI